MTNPRTQKSPPPPRKRSGPLALCGALVLPALAGGLLPAPASANDPPEVSFSRSSYVMNEGQDATVTVKKSGSGEAAVNYTTADPPSGTNNPATKNTDYTPASGQLTFDEDETEKTFTVSALTDSDVTESSEALIVKLSLPDSSDAPETELGSVRQAAVVILNVVPAGSTTTQSGDGNSSDLTVEQCLDAWGDSRASNSCPYTSNQFWMSVTSDQQCEVNTRCWRTSSPFPSDMQKVTGSLQNMSDLLTCDGELKYTCLGSEELAALPAKCEDAWDENYASQQCGSSYGSHSISVSADECRVSTSCGTPAVSASFWGPPEEVQELGYCNDKLSTSCPAPVTVENCKAAWDVSEASDTCSLSGYQVAGIKVKDGQCSVGALCKRWAWYNPTVQVSPNDTSFKGSVEKVKTLKNCDGTLKESSC